MTSFKVPANRHLVAIVAAIFTVGLCLGAVFASLLYSKKLHEVEKTNSALTSFNKGQATLLSQQSIELTNLRGATPTGQPGAAAAVAPTPAGPAGPTAVATATVPGVQASPAAPPQTPAPAVKPATPVQAVPARPALPVVKPAPAPPKAAPAPAAVAKTTPAEALEALRSQGPRPPGPAAPAAAPITLEQAGISGIDTASVRFKSGRQVNIGGEFPSGEKLLSVNPGEGKIVTDRRTILLAKPAPAQ